jgi:hypothetical protein
MMSTNLTNWQPVQSFGVTTNAPMFVTSMNQTECRFFRVQ